MSDDDALGRCPCLTWARTPEMGEDVAGHHPRCHQTYFTKERFDALTAERDEWREYAREGWAGFDERTAERDALAARLEAAEAALEMIHRLCGDKDLAGATAKAALAGSREQAATVRGSFCCHCDGSGKEHDGSDCLVCDGSGCYTHRRPDSLCETCNRIRYSASRRRGEGA